MLIEHLEILNYDELPSTQEFAKQEVLAGRIKPYTVISALKQSAGKGRYGRSWLSKKGNVAITIILPTTPLDHQVSYVTGLAVSDTIKDLCQSLKPELKWVNDVIIGHEKVCGILLERVKSYLLVGIGINLEPDQALKPLKAASITDLGFKIEHSVFLKKLLEKFTLRYNVWSQYGFLTVKDNWKANSYNLSQLNKGRPLKIVYPNGSSDVGFMHDIDNDGNLLLSVNRQIKQVKVAELFNI